MRPRSVAGRSPAGTGSRMPCSATGSTGLTRCRSNPASRERWWSSSCPVPRDSDQAHGRQRRLPAHLGRHRVAVHPRQPEITQDHVRQEPPGRRQPVRAGIGDRDLVPKQLQQLTECFRGIQVIFDDQHPGRRHPVGNQALVHVRPPPPFTPGECPVFSEVPSRWNSRRGDNRELTIRDDCSSNRYSRQHFRPAAPYVGFETTDHARPPPPDHLISVARRHATTTYADAAHAVGLTLEARPTATASPASSVRSPPPSTRKAAPCSPPWWSTAPAAAPAAASSTSPAPWASTLSPDETFHAAELAPVYALTTPRCNPHTPSRV